MPNEPTSTWLHGLSVIQVGHSPALSVAGPALAQLGARLTVVDALPTGLEADVVLIDRIAAPVGLPDGRSENVEEYLTFVETTNTAVWVTASAYGLATTRGDAFGSDLTMLAAGGILGHSRTAPEAAPTVPAGTLALKLVGHVMAASALHGIHLYRDRATPVHLDVSAQASLVATGLTLEMAHALSDCPDEGGSARYGAPSGFVKTRDGSVYVCVLEEHQWRAFKSTLGAPLEDIVTLEHARSQSEFVNDRMADWAAQRTAEECEQILQRAGVPCTAVNSIQEFGRRSIAEGRNFDAAAPDLPALPAEPARARTTGTAHPAERSRREAGRLEALRVLDAGHVLAVPLAAAWLGALGAQVTKLEDPERLDVYRRRGPFASAEAGPNRSAYFNQVNHSKRGLLLDSTRTGVPVDLDGFDVVLENLSPHRARRLGVDSEAVLAGVATPRLGISSSGFGRTGAWSGYRAYGHNIHAFAGVVHATRDGLGRMGDVGTPWADPLTSVALVTWVLAWNLATQDAPLSLDISMAELVAAQISELATAEESPAATERGFFMTLPSSDRLIAVTLRSAEEAETFRRLTGSPAPRVTEASPLVGLAAPALVDAGDDQILSAFLDAGLCASLVYTAKELAADPFLRATGLFRPVVSETLGRYEVTGLPWTVTDADREHLSAAPEVQPQPTLMA